MDRRFAQDNCGIYKYACVIMSSPPTGYNAKSASCTANNQSPVNLSRSTAKNCERVCDFSVDPIETQTAKIAVDAGIIIRLENLSPPPTAVYNSVKYGCSKIEVYGNAQHAYDNTWSQLELVVYFTSPGYKTVIMSVPINSSGATDTPSTRFFNAFVGHTDSQSKISLGQSWAVQNAVPADMSYFVYPGRDFICKEDATWIVYNSPVQINASDYAAVKRVLTSSWRKPLQQLSPPGNPEERQVWFRNATQENPAYMKKDGKVYMKCRRLNTKGQVDEEEEEGVRESFFGGTIEGLENPRPKIKSGGITAKEKKEKDAQTALSAKNFFAQLKFFYIQAGGIWGVLLIVGGTAFAALLGTLWSQTMNELFDWIMVFPNFFHEFLLSSTPVSSKSPR